MVSSTRSGVWSWGDSLVHLAISLVSIWYGDSAPVIGSLGWYDPGVHGLASDRIWVPRISHCRLEIPRVSYRIPLLLLHSGVPGVAAVPHGVATSVTHLLMLRLLLLMLLGL